MNIRIINSLDENAYLSCKTAGTVGHTFLCPTVPAVLMAKRI
ncbi:hypothetical protein CLOSTHATH_06139 [Hungatella hathewayi DSM 13479]|uniref:Uncharacterized protein n=1 Tax=Hungatella hathewayi DSM 13479 TaxID=566550 RepID=D3AR83_9FIRM|nr:hypothetical protein CLOSTHATH_06139 [Hungatella hathewayi DSM 13479]